MASFKLFSNVKQSGYHEIRSAASEIAHILFRILSKISNRSVVDYCVLPEITYTVRNKNNIL